jgi:hypothetical protein
MDFTRYLGILVEPDVSLYIVNISYTTQNTLFIWRFSECSLRDFWGPITCFVLFLHSLLDKALRDQVIHFSTISAQMDESDDFL